MDPVHDDCELQGPPSYVHTPYTSPFVVGAASSWQEAFGMAETLLRKKQLDSISFTPSDKYPGRDEFKIIRLRDRGEPVDVLEQMADKSPHFFGDVLSIDLYLFEGRIVTPVGIETCWRLDFVLS